MRLWVSAFVFLGGGALLLWLAAGQLDAAWPRSVRTISGDVATVDTRVIAGATGRESRYVVQLEGRAQRFELASFILPRPTAGALIDAGRVTIDYDTKVRIRANDRSLGSCAMKRQAKAVAASGDRSCAQYEALYVVAGLAVDGRVYFTPWTYRLVTASSALIVLVPGAVMFGLGALWLYRLLGSASLRATPGGASRAQLAVARDPRKTADGQWLH